MTTSSPWPPTDPREREKLLARLAQAHFVNGISKVALANEARLSRFQVASLLQEAQDSGIVRIEIALPHDNTDAHLAEALGIRRVVTVDTGRWPADRRALAQATAREVTRVLHHDDVLGISWSRTLQFVVRELPPLPHVEVIQLAGALSSDGEERAPRLLAELQCRSAWPLWAPLVVEHAEFLRRSVEIAETLRRADRLDVALIAIGGWGPELSTVWHRLDSRLAEQTRRDGAVAEISGHLLAADGTLMHTPVESMIVAASPEQIRSAGTTVAVAYQAERAPAVRAAARAGLADILVCDASLRDALLDAGSSPQSEQNTPATR